MDDRSSKTPAAKRGVGNRSKTSRGQGPPDPNVSAFNLVQMVTGQMDKPAVEQPEKNQAAVSLGRLGGLKGGKARATKLTPERRVEIAKKAAEKRWGSGNLLP